MEKTVRITTGLIAFAMLIPLQMVGELFHFRTLSLFMWLSSVTLLIFILLKGAYGVLGYEEENAQTPRYLSLAFLISKTISAFSLIIVAFLFLMDLIISWFTYSSVSLKLVLPFALLGVLGNHFLRDKEVSDWINVMVTKWTPVIETWIVQARRYYNERLRPWVLKRKIWVGGALSVLILALIIPSLFRSVPTPPKLLGIQVNPEDSIGIYRDFNQRISIEVFNNSQHARNVYLEASQTGGDSLILGFVGDGSNYEKVRLQAIPAGYRHVFDLLIHASTAQASMYKFEIKLFESDNADGSVARLADKQSIAVNIDTGPLKVGYELVAEEPFSLRKTYRITNKGRLISDFSLEFDDVLNEKATISPLIQHYRFAPGEELLVNIEPDLFVGFSGLAGKVYGRSAATATLLEIPLAFNPPGNKKLFLAVAHCGSESSTRIRECINRGRTNLPVDNPPGNNGSDPTTTDSGPIHVDPPIEIGSPHHHGSETTEHQPEPEHHPEGEEFRDPFSASAHDPGSATREQILHNARNLKEKLNLLLEKFGPDVQSRIKRAIQSLDEVILIVERTTELNVSDIHKVNELMRMPNTVFNELIDHELINDRRGGFGSASSNSPYNGSTNLRINGVTGSKDNSGAPTMYFTSSHIHFAWHQLSSFGSANQRVFYSKHSRKGPLVLGPVEMNPGSEYGRWPFVLEENGEVFYTWQGNQPGSAPEINFRKSLDSGRTWQNPVRITTHGQGTFSPRLTYFKGTLYAYWIDYNAPNPQLVVSYSKNKGNTFSFPYLVSPHVKADGVARLIVHDESLQFVFESVRNGQNLILYRRIDHREIQENSQGQSQEAVICRGSQPAIAMDDRKALHMTYVDGTGLNSEVLYLSLQEFWNGSATPVRITRDSAYTYSPSLSFANDMLHVMYHSNSSHPQQFLDHLYMVSAPGGSSTWPEAYRLPSLASNAKHIYLSVNFSLPWDRRIYDAHNVKVLLNGWQVGHLKNMIPEGKMLFPISPRILQKGGRKAQPNGVTLLTEHFNPAHYLAASEVSLIADLNFVEQFVYASSQKEADELLTARKDFNHDKPDLGVYASSRTRVPISPKDGEVITVNLRIWNVGQGISTASRIDIFGGAKDMTEEEYADRNLLAQKRLPALGPQKSIDLNLPITYWSGLEKIVIRAVTKEEDFNINNNAYTITFKGRDMPNSDSLNLRQDDNGVLRVALYDQPGIVATDVNVEIFRSGSNETVDSSTSNPKIFILPADEYDIYIKSSSIADVEQWIRGVPIGPVLRLRKGERYYQGSVSVDVLLQKIDVTLDSLNAVKVGSEIMFSMPSTILFHPNQYEINLFAEDYLKRVKTVLNAYPKSTLKIEGHTDDLGDANDNLLLSERRATEVKRWLAEKENIDASRMVKKGWGESMPIATNTTAEGRMKNRRVNFTIDLH